MWKQFRVSRHVTSPATRCRQTERQIRSSASWVLCCRDISRFLLCSPTIALVSFTSFGSPPPAAAQSPQYRQDPRHLDFTLQPLGRRRGLKIGLINIACFDRFNIDAKIVTHQLFIPQCCPSRLLSPSLPLSLPCALQIVWQPENRRYFV